MEQYLAAHEIRVAWLLFVCAFVLIGAGETFRPRKSLRMSTPRRWCGNAILAASVVAADALYPIGGTAVAFMVLKNPYGLLNRASVPFALRCALAVMVFDFLRYAEHYLFHHNSLLWRIHRVHHSDRDFDLTTGVRNHPGEVILGQAAYLAAVALLAPPPLALIGLGIAVALQNLFSHANLRLPEIADRSLRPFFVTPDMHRIHHSERFEEQNSNYGFIFPWWDKLCGTYRALPADGHEDMRIGLEELPDDRSANGLYLLTLPFRDLANTASPAAPGSSAPVVDNNTVAL